MYRSVAVDKLLVASFQTVSKKACSQSRKRKTIPVVVAVRIVGST